MKIYLNSLLLAEHSQFKKITQTVYDGTIWVIPNNIQLYLKFYKSKVQLQHIRQLLLCLWRAFQGGA